jgi:membrane associated rhomboid family serine protease
VAAAAVVGGIFGPRLGNLVLVLATSFGGAYLVVIALSALFQDTVGPEVGDPAQPLALLGTSFPLVLFATITAISFLGQQQTSDLRRRLLR